MTEVYTKNPQTNRQQNGAFWEPFGTTHRWSWGVGLQENCEWNILRPTQLEKKFWPAECPGEKINTAFLPKPPTQIINGSSLSTSLVALFWCPFAKEHRFLIHSPCTNILILPITLLNFAKAKVGNTSLQSHQKSLNQWRNSLFAVLHRKAGII